MNISAFEIREGNIASLGSLNMKVVPREGDLLAIRVGSELIKFHVDKVIHMIEGNVQKQIRLRLVRESVPTTQAPEPIPSEGDQDEGEEYTW